MSQEKQDERLEPTFGRYCSVETWVLPITHGTWRSSLSGKKQKTMKIGVTRICCERSSRVVE